MQTGTVLVSKSMHDAPEFWNAKLSNADVARLADWIAGAISSADVAETERWIAESPVRAAIAARLGAAKRAIHEHDSARASQLTQCLQHAMLRAASSPYQTPRTVRSSMRFTARRDGVLTRFSPQIVSAGIGVLALVVALWAGTRTTEIVTASSQRYVTATGQRATLVFRDGRRITLASGTTLSTAGDRARSVALVGEATFDIPSHRSTPFTVRAGPHHIAVLGTTFDVQRYANVPETRIAVIVGKVALQENPVGHAIVLAAGAFGIANDSVITVTSPADVGGAMEWTRGQLVFRDTPIPEALETVGHWCGYQFRVTDSTLIKQHVTVSLATHSASDMLAALKTLLNVTMTFDGNVIVLHSRTSGRMAPAQHHSSDSLTISPSHEVGR